MKARSSSPLAVGLALSLLLFVGACTEDNAESASLLSPANAGPALSAVDNTNPPAPAANAPAPAAEAEAVETVAAVPEPAPAEARPLPNVVRSNSPTADVIKLAQAGVDQTVMLNFITNTTSMFVLSSDEIIYLNDLGVPAEVVTAMMQRDQEIKQFWTTSGKPPEPPPAPVANVVADTQAAAPTYVTPPQPEVAAPAPPVEPAQPVVVNNNYFYDTLSPYGTWVEIEGYGRCWQPTVVVANRGWHPYSDGGRWVYTDAGWYWLSDYSWGATAFHYGRWFNHARWGWCWWPDTVWAPSWVSFRYSGDYCGWAPLPPHAYYRTGLGFSYNGRSVGFSFDFGLNSSCYTFVSWNRFCDSRPWHHRVPHHEVNRIYNHTTIVNNYGTGGHNTVVNRGISPERYREHTRAELRPATIRTENGLTRQGGRGERLERDGRSIVVNRPQIPTNPRQDRSRLTTPNSEATPNSRPAAGGTALTERSRALDRNRSANDTRVNRPIGGTLSSDPSRPERREANNPSASSETQVNRSVPAIPARPERQNDNQRSRGTGNTPVIVNGGGTASPAQSRPTPNPASSVPAGSLVVIGKRDPNSNNDSQRPSRADAAQRPVNVNAPTVSPSQTRPATTPTPSTIPTRDTNFRRSNLAENDSGNSITRSQSPTPRPTQTWSAPVQTTPRPTTVQPIQRQPATEQYNGRSFQNQTPARPVTPPSSYSAPAPAPRVAPSPAPQPAPSYTPPPSRPAPSESRAATPERSAPRNDGGGRNRRDN